MGEVGRYEKFLTVMEKKWSKGKHNVIARPLEDDSKGASILMAESLAHVCCVSFRSSGTVSSASAVFFVVLVVPLTVLQRVLFSTFLHLPSCHADKR